MPKLSNIKVIVTKKYQKHPIRKLEKKFKRV